jgi:hypothetical protein
VGYRIKNLAELEAMKKDGRIGKGIAKQIHTILCAPTKSPTAPAAGAINSVFTEHLNRHKRYDSVSVDRALRQGREHFYMLPEHDSKPDPAVILYRACVRRWGRYYEGGLVVHELMIRAPRSFVCDIALVNFRICIEFDGYQFHSGLKDVKRDHAKTEQLSRLGWLVFRVGYDRVKNDLDSFLDSVQMAIDHSPFGDVQLKRFAGKKDRASFNSLLLAWHPQTATLPVAYQYSA